ncbi:MAG: RIP metalloprotease RseP [Prevotellaceae bacterium]|jgi:regulator of sigma E protease|nr:RIP metalloprotease RseP [Prevotellaceae bacterium]
METFLIKALQLIMSLSLLVLIHEGGHFLFARLFKTRVEKFCLFFDPWFTLFKWKPKHSETEYGIGWLPLGGYVKIAGMIDESMDTEQMKQPVKPWEFRAKPAWQRLLIMTGGVLFNFLLALFIYSMILFAWGDQYIPLQKAPLGMEFNQTAKNAGFRDGDILLKADDRPLVRLGGNMLSDIVEARQVTVLRGGQEATVYIPSEMMEQLMADSVGFAYFRYPFMIDSIGPHSPAALAGLQAGDSITQLDGHDIAYSDFKAAMLARRQEAGASHQIRLTYVRSGVTDTATVVTDSLFNIGVRTVGTASRLLPVVNVSYGFFASFPAGAKLGVETLSSYVSNMKYVFSKEGAKQLGGFGTLGSIFPNTWDWNRFWYMTAFLSIILAFMNILPIPALDGGHVLFLLYEVITRRKPSDKFMERAQMVGMALIFGLLIWANFNDVMRFFF